MLTLLGGLVGLLGPLLPDALKGILGFFQDKADKKHELEMLNKQLDKKIDLQDKVNEGEVNAAEAKALLAELTASQENIKSARDHDTASQDVMARILESAKGTKVFSFILILFAFAQFLIVTVRPLLAHAVTIFWGLTKIAQANALFQVNGDVFMAIKLSWTEDDYAIFALILGFYFGDKIKKRMQK